MASSMNLRKTQTEFNKLQKRLRREVGTAIADYNMIEDGDKIMFLNKIIPDVSINEGNLSFTIETQSYPAGPITTKGPYIINSGTEKIDFRARGRQASIRVSTSDQNINWRWGTMRLAIQPDGDR